MTATDWLTLSLVLITAFYAWVTYRILRANEAIVEAMTQQTEAQTRPYVVAAISVRTGTTLFCLEIQNTGKSPAVNLKLGIDRDFYPHGEKREDHNLAKLVAFTQPIESLAPGTRLVFNLGVGGKVFSPDVGDELCPKVFTITAEYEFGGKSYREPTTLDIRPMLRGSVVQDPVATELEKLRQSLERLLVQRT